MVGKLKLVSTTIKLSRTLTEPEIAGNTQAAPMRQIIIGADNQLLSESGIMGSDIYCIFDSNEYDPI
jgi:hypothetical protein